MLAVLENLQDGDKAVWLGDAGAAGASTQAQLDAFRAALDAIWNHEQCEACCGHGHDANSCPTRAKVDKDAKNNGCYWLWGAIKGACYYREWLYAGNRPPQPRRYLRVRRRFNQN